jgi:endonuclease G
LLTVTVSPATNPASTGITVAGDLSTIGGSSTQTFFDDGTNGDSTAGDNTFSYLAAVPANASSGGRSLTVSVTDAQARTASTAIVLTVRAAANPLVHLTMGNPTGATTDVNNPFNYLLLKDQYAMSYHRDRGTPNWVAWHLDASWLGSTPRQDDFRPDPTLPAGWYQVQATDYSGSGFDRGHHTPSGDRTASVPDNSATFLMTNMMPQAPFNNQGPWEELETYCRTLVQQGNELYIYAGGAGQGGTGTNGGVTMTIANGKVTVPAYTWNVIIVLPSGDNDVDRVVKTTRVIAVVMPNSNAIGINTPWRNFRTRVKTVQALTGFDFFTNVRPMMQQFLENKIDVQ